MIKRSYQLGGSQVAFFFRFRTGITGRLRKKKSLGIEAPDFTMI